MPAHYSGCSVPVVGSADDVGVSAGAAVRVPAPGALEWVVRSCSSSLSAASSWVRTSASSLSVASFSVRSSS